jgi:AAA ATPase-like protein
LSSAASPYATVYAHELVGAGAARTRLEAAARRGLTRFVGRNAELEQLRDALDRANLGHGQVVAVVGEPGVGKSRLFWELIHSHRVHGWLIVQSASVSYGKATAYLPVIELLRGYFGIDNPGAGRARCLPRLVAGARNHLPANRPLEFRFEVSLMR